MHIYCRKTLYEFVSMDHATNLLSTLQHSCYRDPGKFSWKASIDKAHQNSQCNACSLMDNSP